MMEEVSLVGDDMLKHDLCGLIPLLNLPLEGFDESLENIPRPPRLKPLFSLLRGSWLQTAPLFLTTSSYGGDFCLLACYQYNPADENQSFNL